MVSLPVKMGRGKSGPDDAVHPLQPVEIEVIELFVQLSRVLGQPRSFGQIYGLLFISPQPLALDDVRERLQISKGSASQGLKFLREIGAIRPGQVPGARRVHYEAVAELRNLAGSFLREKIEPHVRTSKERLQRLTLLAQSLPDGPRNHALQRISILRSWSRNSRRVLPLVLRVLGG